MTPAMTKLMHRLMEGEVVNILSTTEPKIVLEQIRYQRSSLQSRVTFEESSNWHSIDHIRMSNLMYFAENQEPDRPKTVPESDRQIEI